VINKEKEAEILRLYHAERWSMHTIARQIGVHHSTVKRVLFQAGETKASRRRSALSDPYIPLIVETLGKYPKLSARRLFEMAKARGYSGGPDHFRRVVSLHRPRKTAEAYQRLSTLPGEQAQVDWAHFGSVTIGRATRKLYAFVLVLSWSRAAWVRFYLGSSFPYFLRGHIGAFEHFGGVPRVCLYDNLKSAVLERQGDAIRFNPKLLEFAGHYRFEPRPVAVARGNEKGRVERLIRYLRGSFFEGRSWKDVDDLNRQVELWLSDVSAKRPWPDDKRRTVSEMFEEERSKLLPLPENPFPADERCEVEVGKTPYVRFDLNDYSVPHTYVRRSLSVVATLSTVRVLDGLTVIAEHTRTWDRGATVEEASHIQALGESKRRAREHRGLNRLLKVASSTQAFLRNAAERGLNIGSLTSRLLSLLDTYGPRDFEEALVEALERDRIHAAAVRHVLERNRAARALPAPSLVRVAPKRHADLVVTPHNLGSYDSITTKVNTDDDS
jgi:transposase